MIDNFTESLFGKDFASIHKKKQLVTDRSKTRLHFKSGKSIFISIKTKKNNGTV